MSTFFNYAIKDEYARIAERGNSLGEVSSLIDRDSFRPLLLDLYTNTEGKGGRPNYDVVFMIKLLVLQQWYGLSDPQLEREAYDRLSFRHFLGYPTSIPDAPFADIHYLSRRSAETKQSPGLDPWWNDHSP